MSTDTAQILSDLTGGVISREEAIWTFDRMKALLAAGISKANAKAIIAGEARDKPWLRPPPPA